MIELRAARPDELDAMLAVMCEAFMLPYGPARDIFYRDPYFDIECKRVLVKDGEVISCLTIVDSTMWIGASVVKVGGIASVATKSSHRRQGYASRLLMETLPVLHELGYAFSALFPFSYRFYSRFGWERAGTQLRALIAPATLPRFADARNVRVALPADRAEMARLYDIYSHQRTGHLLRDEKRWLYLFEYVKQKVVYKRSEMEGYALYEINQTVEGTPALRLLEFVALTEEARRGLVGFLAQQTEVAHIEYTTSWTGLHQSSLLEVGTDAGEGKGGHIEVGPGVMFRLVNFQKALEALQPNFYGFAGELTLLLTDAQSPTGTPQAVTLEGGGTSVRVHPAKRSANPRVRIEGDIRTWSQVLVGYLSLHDALALHRLRAYSNRAISLATPLFPRRELLIPTTDHF
jgi:predicted acetyltransferase